MKYGWTHTTEDGVTVELVNVPDSNPPMIELTVIESDENEDEQELGVAVARISEDKLQALALHILGGQPYQQPAPTSWWQRWLKAIGREGSS